MNPHDCGNLTFQDAADCAEANAGRVRSNKFLFAEALAAETETPILRMCVAAYVHALIGSTSRLVHDDLQALTHENYSELLLRTCEFVPDLKK
jgi:hypothetical protein